jgi:predicted ATPase/DNA-binding SARP family transcriptional activator
MSPRLALHLLGPPKLEIDNSPVTVDRRKTLALLAYLAVNRGGHTRDFLSGMLWPGYDQERAFSNLRHILWETQQSIGEGWMLANRETVGFIAAGVDRGSGRNIWLDVAQFETLAAEWRAQTDISLRIPLLMDSVKLYRNHFLTGFSLKDSPHFNEWAFTVAEDLRHQFAGALSMLAGDHCSLGQAETAIPYAKRLVALDPLNEASHRQLMQVYVQAGQNTAAMKQFHTCEQTLRKELGVDPQPETRALYKQIRKGEIKPIQPVKQKEIGAPGHNIPFQISKFIGREEELDAIADLIADHRLVTLVGTGGIGKTRLALKTGEQLLNKYANGVWFVELASLSDPVLVPQAVAQLFHIAEQADEPLTQKLARVLRSRTFLIILDNCEHLLDASAQLADALLKSCPNLKVLVTSREPLRITGEAQYHVPSLGLPDLQQLLEKMLGYESIQLFEERARLVQENFSLTMENASSIAQICHRLDGIPLAIELAAARVDMFSTEQIAARLDESLKLLTGGSRTALSRQQTLRASIDWSWKLLSEPEQVLLQRLAIFAGGWTLEGADEVCEGGFVKASDVLDLLGDLVEKSLVLFDSGNARYRMLETIRQYAHEKFRETDEVDIIREKHLAWMVAWAEQIQPELHGRNQVARFNDAENELNNIRQAVEWGLRTGQIESSMRIYIALSYFMDGHVPFQESRRWLEMGISRREQMSKDTLARTFSEAAWLTFRQDDPKSGIPFAEESLALAEELGDQLLIACALRSMGRNQVSNGDFTLAEHYYEKSRLLFQELGDNDGLVSAVSALSIAVAYQDNFPRARQLLEDHLRLLDDLDDVSTSAWFHFALGSFKVLQGELDQAADHLKNSLLLYRQINHFHFIGNCLIACGALANGRKQFLRAAQIFGAREAMHDSIGTNLDPGLKRLYIFQVDQTRAMLNESDFASAWDEGREMTMEQAIEYALNEE